MSETFLDTFSDAAAALLRLGLSNAASAALLALLVAGITLPLRRRRPAVVHALWLLVLLKLITPPLWTIPVQWRAETRPAKPAILPPPADAPGESFATVEELPFVEVAPASASVEPPAVDWNRVAVAAVGVIWLAGSAACGTLFVLRSLQFRRLLKEATAAPADVVRRVRRVGSRLGVERCPSAWFVPGAVCPMLYAAGRPRLLLPRGLWERLDGDQRDTLIAHELAHLRRRDHWVRFAEVAATALYWWFPVLWWARRELREAEEQCCDAWVVWSMPSAVRDYMSAILAAVDFVSVPETHNPPFAPPAVPALASGMGEFRRLERRLWMIRANTSPHRLSRTGVLAVLLGAAALPLAPTLAGEDEKQTTVTRDVVVTQTEPSTDIRVDTSDVQVDTDAVISFSPDVQELVVEGGDIKVALSDDVVTDHVVDGKVVETHGITLRLVDGSDLDQARAQVEQARVNLKMAEARLKQLEVEAKERGKADKAGGKSAKMGIVGKSADKPTPKTNSIKGRIVENDSNFKFSKGDVDPTAKSGHRDQEKRMEKLEQKLDALMSELREIKKEEGRTNSDKVSPAGRQ